MNVFDLRDRLVGDYASYTASFIKIADARDLSQGAVRASGRRLLARADASAQPHLLARGHG